MSRQRIFRVINTVITKKHLLFEEFLIVIQISFQPNNGLIYTNFALQQQGKHLLLIQVPMPKNFLYFTCQFFHHGLFITFIYFFLLFFLHALPFWQNPFFLYGSLRHIIRVFCRPKCIVFFVFIFLFAFFKIFKFLF